jgi:hypothetical protein
LSSLYHEERQVAGVVEGDAHSRGTVKIRVEERWVAGAAVMEERRVRDEAAEGDARCEGAILIVVAGLAGLERGRVIKGSADQARPRGDAADWLPTRSVTNGGGGARTWRDQS